MISDTLRSMQLAMKLSHPTRFVVRRSKRGCRWVSAQCIPIAIFGVASFCAGVASIARADLPIFTESAVERGVDYVVADGSFGGLGQYGCGVLLCDLDNDGDDDLMGTGATTPSIALYANDGAGQFTSVTASSGITSHTQVSGIVAADYDGDGDLDIFVTRWLQSAVLYRNNGGLHFTNVTVTAGLGGNVGAGAGCSFGDFDADGDLDLAIANRTGTLGNTLRNRFYRNNGQGTFTEIGAALGVDDGGASFQCLLQDLDRDGDCDLYVSTDKGTPTTFTNRYFRNVGGAFVSEPANGASIAIDSMGVFAGDVDMNGFVDIYCANVATGHALLLTDDAQTYVRAEFMAGVAGQSTGWGTAIFDPDNDGDQDIFLCSMLTAPDYLWMNESGFPFVDRSAACGLGDGIDSYCLATSDVDRDGDVDLLVQPHLAKLRLYMNAAPQKNRSIRFKVHGFGQNTHAVGALIDIESNGKTILREVMAGSCYKSQSSYIVHGGLGRASVASRVVVRWPRVGTEWKRRVLTNLPAGYEWPVYPTEQLGDADHDGVVDADDVVDFESCVATAFLPPCAIFDFDGDSDVDELDRRAIGTRLCDLDGNGVVGASDLSKLLASWGTETHDLTGDGIVGADDMSILLANW